MTYERKLHEPGQEECQQLLRGNVRAGRQAVVEVVPRAPEDTSKHYGENVTGVERLDPIPDDANNSSNKYKEV